MRTLHSRASLWARVRSVTIISPRLPNQLIRHFHSTRPSPLIGEVLNASSAFLHGVHNITGLPWAASIPLTAFIVRMVVAMPLQIYTKVHARRQRDLVPVMQSWGRHYEADMANEMIQSSAGGENPPTQDEFNRNLASLSKSKRKELLRRWKVPRLIGPVAFLQVPVWISLMEALRAMCGNNRGLLALVMTKEVTEDGVTSAYSVPLFEPTLATEGALWFPNLLIGDPTGILSIMLTATILLNVSSGWKSLPLKEISDLPNKQMDRQLVFRCMKLGAQIFAIYIGIASSSYSMPAGLMVYWISSGNIATLQNLYLNRCFFARKPLPPWREYFVGVNPHNQRH